MIYTPNRDVRINSIAALKEQGAEREKEINQMFERHRHQINDIIRQSADNEHF